MKMHSPLPPGPDLVDGLVSVITPTFNSALTIGATISSVLQQDYPSWEMLVVDDASTDGTADIVRGFAAREPRIRVQVQTTNQGAAAARNRAITMARGRYLAFLDSDDLWEPGKLSVQTRFMRDQECPFSFAGYRVISTAGQPVGQVTRIPSRLAYDDYLKNSIIGCLTVMLDRVRLPPVHFPDLRSRQDFALWLSILRTGVVAQGIPQVLGSYRLVTGSLSRNKWKGAKAVWRVYRNHERLSLAKAAFCFASYALHAIVKAFLNS
jgi:teichuronic acid biosynthesis glycosyltransferase TuaG